jgi:NurA-like 5'-3' nuclease
MYRLIDRRSVNRIKSMLQRGYEEARGKMAEVEWRPLPKERESCTVYAVDGSQGKQRLSGTIFYTVSSYAFGNGPSYRLVYTNAMLYNQGISDQIIRLQMETLENKLGFLAAELGEVEYVMMDGTLTGSLTRPPVYPESVRGITTIKNALGDDELERLVDDFVERLKRHYAELEEGLKNAGKVSTGVILADEVLDEYSSYYRAMVGHREKNFDGTLPKQLRVSQKTIERAIEEGKTVEELYMEILEEYGEDRTLSLEDARNSVHVVLGYLEYLYSLEKLLGSGQFDLVYVAKSFYNRKLTQKLGIDVVDVPYLDAYLRRKFGEEIPGYYVITQGGGPISHRLPKVLRKHFSTVEQYIKRGVAMAYIRTMKGGVIYLLQSNRTIDDELLSRVLWHESNGYFRPLQRAHEGVKIEKKAFEAELAALLNIIKKESPELRVFLKYGRSPLE